MRVDGSRRWLGRVVGVLCAVMLPHMQAAVAADGKMEKVTIMTDFTPAGSHAALHLAFAKGWFKEAGLDVDLRDGKGSLSVIQLVGRGEIDFGQLSVSTVPAAREAGMKVKSVAAFARRSDLAVIVPQDSALKSARDLKGKELVVFANSPWVPLINIFLSNAGMTRDDVSIKFVDPNAMYSVYSIGRADGVMTLAPFALAIVEKSRPSRAIDAADYGINLPALGLVTRDSEIASRPEVVKKVVQTTIRAWKYIQDGHADEAVAAVLQNRPGFKLDPEILTSQAKAYLRYFDTPATEGKPIGWQSAEDWERALTLMKNAEIIKTKVSVEDVFTNEFVGK